MKKIFTFFAAMAISMSAMATDFKDELAIYLNGDGPVTSQATVTVDEVAGTDGDYNITLNNFNFSGMLIGDVAMKNVKGNDDSEGNTWFETEQDAEITNGGDIAAFLGGKVHVTIKEGSRMKDGKLYLVLSLPVDLSALGQVFNVDAYFGTGGYQIPNSGFEAFHKETYRTYESDEPNNWHSFMSSTGSLAAFVKPAIHTYISDEVRPGSYGTSSVRVVSALALGSIPANGTLTTGRLQAGAFSAADPGNCSFLDMSSEDVDGNGDPFYAVLNGQPDSLAVWVKFKQGTLDEENKDAVYATVSAAITDGTRYQDPEDTEVTYTNVVAKAQNATIESKDFAWQRVTAAFDYDKYATNNAATKAILVTISTNAQPGVGSTDENTPDELYVDEFELIYNHSLTSLMLKGTEVADFSKDVTEYDVENEGKLTEDDITAVSDGRGAIIKKAIEDTENGQKITVTVLSNDYKKSTVYTVNVKDLTSGVNSVVSADSNETVAVYNINGQKVSDMSGKGIYILRKADGSSVKVIKE